MSGTNGRNPQTAAAAAAEEALVGSLLCPWAGEALDSAAATIRAEHFHNLGLGHVFAAALELRQRGDPVEVVTLARELERAGVLEAVGGSSRLVQLQVAGGPASSVPTYAAIILEDAERRGWLHASHELREAWRTGDRTLAERALEAVTASRVGPTSDSLDPAALDWSTFWEPEGDGGDWLVEPLLPAGRQTAVFASAKTGKSLLALEVSAASATGRAILDQPAGPAQGVLYLDYEQRWPER